MSFQAEIFDPFVQNNPTAAEVTERRRLHGRVYDLGPAAEEGKRKFAAIVSNVPLHWNDNGELKDNDVRLQAITGGWGIRSGPYTLELKDDAVKFRITHKETGKVVEYTLLRINGTPVGNIGVYNVNPTKLNDKRVAYANVVPGMDIFFIPRPYGVEWFKRLTNNNVNSITWGVEYPTADGTDGFTIQQDATGYDAKDREYHVENTQETRTDRRAGWTSVLRTETFHHEVKWRDPNRVAEWNPGVEYPVIIDASVSVDIAASGDDGVDTEGSFVNSRCKAYHNYYSYPGHGWYDMFDNPMWRFLSVAVPQGSTIDSGTVVKVNVNNIVNTGPHGSYTGQKIKVYGNDIDTCPALSNTKRLFNGWTLTPSASAPPVTHHLNATGIHSVDVQSVVQTIVNRAGWSSGHIGIGGKIVYRIATPLNTQKDLAHMDDLATGGTTTQLVVQYTASGSSIPLFQHHYKQLAGAG